MTRNGRIACIRLVLAAAGVVTVALAGTGQATAATSYPGSPSEGTNPAVGAATNPNPIDWSIRSTYYGSGGEDIPLRNGQHDAGPVDGFGWYHILDGHEETGNIPTSQQFAETLQEGTCQRNTGNDTYGCNYNDGTLNIFVSYTERIDDASGDGRPVGIITGYTTLPCRATSTAQAAPAC